MNLEDLKPLWVAESKHALDHDKKSEQEILHLLQKRGLALLRRINRSIYIEMGLLLLITALAVAWHSRQEGGMTPLLWGYYGGWLGFFTLFYLHKHYLLNRVSLTVADLRSALGRLTRLMALYMRIYYFFLYILVPVLSSAGGLGGFLFALHEDGRSLGSVPLRSWAILYAAMMAYSAVWVLLCHAYVDLMYGRSYRALRQCHQELQESLAADKGVF